MRPGMMGEYYMVIALAGQDKDSIRRTGTNNDGDALNEPPYLISEGGLAGRQRRDHSGERSRAGVCHAMALSLSDWLGTISFWLRRHSR